MLRSMYNHLICMKLTAVFSAVVEVKQGRKIKYSYTCTNIILFFPNRRMGCRQVQQSQAVGKQEEGEGHHQGSSPNGEFQQDQKLKLLPSFHTLSLLLSLLKVFLTLSDLL